MRHAFKLILPACLLSTQALAWGDLGHQTTAEIAQRHLTDKARSLVLGYTAAEPMAFTATWPDSVREDKGFDPLKPYHFISISEGQQYPQEIVREDAYAILRNAKTILLEPDNKDVLASDSAAVKAQKVVAARARKTLYLRYLIHVAGDVHQPHHVGGGLDFGANSCNIQFVSADGVTSQKNLHSFWDGPLVDITKTKYQKEEAAKTGRLNFYFSRVDLANALEAKYATWTKSDDFQADLTPEDTLKWVMETRDLRLKMAYPDALVKYNPSTDGGDLKRPYCKIKTAESTDAKPYPYYDEKRVPTVNQNEDFAKEALAQVELQLVKGGYRLAALLNWVAKDLEAPGKVADFPALDVVIKSLTDRWMNPEAAAQPK